MPTTKVAISIVHIAIVTLGTLNKYAHPLRVTGVALFPGPPTKAFFGSY